MMNALFLISASLAGAAISPVQAPPADPMLHVSVVDLGAMRQSLVYAHAPEGVSVRCPESKNPSFACNWLASARFVIPVDWRAEAERAGAGSDITARDRFGGVWKLLKARDAGGEPSVGSLPRDSAFEKNRVKLLPRPDFAGYTIETDPRGTRAVGVLRDADSLREAVLLVEARRRERFRRVEGAMPRAR